MKTMKYTKHIFSIIAGGSLLLSACTASENPEEITGNLTGKLTFSVSLEKNSGASTRLTNDGDEAISQIGKGNLIDKLEYAVYMVDEATGKYVEDLPLHPAQTLSPVDFSDNKRVEFTIENLEPGRTYHVAFWAQNSACEAYDTSDLSCVEVKYKDSEGNNFANNDESRDAFCQKWTGKLSNKPEDAAEISVTLTRPLAQINVGTTGADYKNIMYGKDVYPNLRITHSRISVNGVARFLNVVEGRILLGDDMAALGKESSEAFTNVTFDWGVLPAFMNMQSLPSTDKDLLQSEDEEYLRVDLNRDGKISDYLLSYPTLSSDGSTALTETFKYLSMCYVLAPAGETGKATYEGISVGFSENGDGLNGSNTVKLTTANGGFNYRTNILGGLAWVKDPDNSADPDDPDIPDNPDDPNNPGEPGEPEDPEIPEDPVPSLFYYTIKLLVQTDFQGSTTSDKDQSWSITWTQNSQE